MSVTLYSLGDHEIIRAGLTAVAMLFDSNNTDMLTGAGAAGLGHAAAFGLLVSMGWIAMRVLVGQPFSPGHLIAILLAYIIMFVPKTTVVVEDIYSGQAAVVDDVPIGVALPGGLISGVSRSITLKLDQALRSVDTETSTLSEHGMASPLKLMLAARGAALMDQAFTLSFSRYIADCTDGIPPNAVNTATTPYFFLQNPFPYFSTVYYPTSITPSNTNQWESMETVTCTDAAVRLTDKLNLLLSSPEYNEHLTQQMAGRRPNATLNGRWEASDLQMFINNFAQAGVDAQGVMAQLAASDIIADTYRCGALDAQDAINCSSAMRTALEGSKFDSAGRASAFSRAMIPSMNVFMFLFFAIAPLIAVIIAVSGMHGVTKVLPNYFLFGVWTQSWLPVAAIVNHFIVRQTKDAAQLGLITADGLQLKAGLQFYDLLSNKIAAASDLLASTPIVTLAIIGGSIMGLAQLASKSGDHFNEKNLAPEVNRVNPAVDAAPRMSNVGNTLVEGPSGVFAQGAQKGLYSLSYSSQAASTVASKETAALESANQQMMSAASSAGSEYGKISSTSHALASGSTTSAMFQQGKGFSFDFGRNFSRGMNQSLSESETKALDASITQMGMAASSAMVTGARMGLAGKGLQNFVREAVKSFAKDKLSSMSGALPNLSRREAFSAQLEKTLGEQFGSSEKEMDTWAANFSQGKASKDEVAYADQTSAGYKSSFSSAISSARSNVQKHGQAAERAKAVQQAAGSEIKYDPERTGMTGSTSANWMEWARDTLKGQGLEGGINAASERLKRLGLFAGAGDDKKREAAAMGMLLAGTASGQEAAVRLAQAETGVDNMSFIQSAKGAESEANSTLASTNGTGLNSNEQGAVAAQTAMAESEGDTARNKTANNAQDLAQGRTQAASAPSIADHTANANRASAASSASGVGDRNANRVTAMPHSEMVQQGSAKLKAEFQSNHGFAELVGNFGKEMLSNPALAAIAAAGGGAAAMSALKSIQNHKLAGLGGNNMSLAEYGQKVMQRFATKAPALAAQAGARHIALTATGAAGLGVGIGVLNAVGVVSDVVDVATTISDAMREVDQEAAGGKKPNG